MKKQRAYTEYRTPDFRKVALVSFVLSDTDLGISEAIESLNIREKEIILDRWGLKTGYLRTLKDVGVSKGVTPERLRQIEAKAFRKMRRFLRTKSERELLAVKSRVKSDVVSARKILNINSKSVKNLDLPTRTINALLRSRSEITTIDRLYKAMLPRFSRATGKRFDPEIYVVKNIGAKSIVEIERCLADLWGNIF
jgi:hypothetical protein